jgi:MoxR-like ATPase
MHVSEALCAYLLDLAAATRGHPRLALGLSTRGVLALLKAARVVAGMRDSAFVTPDDVKQAAPWVLAHRLVLTPEATLEGASDAEIVQGLLASTPVPR